MSMRLKGKIPFLNKNILKKSLDNLEVIYEELQDRIELKEYRSYRATVFKKNSLNSYYLEYENEIKNKIMPLEEKIEKEYKKEIEIENKLEEERLRKEYIASRKNKIIEAAKREGYQIKEKEKNGKIHLILRRVTY